MKIGYRREINHNYIEIKQEEDYFEYQVEMITRNRISGLLNCVREKVDNKTTFLYEINSRQPFVQVFEKTKVDYEMFCQMVTSLKNAVEEVESYLLDANSLVLNPEYIYMNPETKEIELIYLPGYWENMKEGLHELAKQLLNWIDYKNEKVVAAAYELFKQTAEENYTFESILCKLEKETLSRKRVIKTEWEVVEESVSDDTIKSADKWEQEQYFLYNESENDSEEESLNFWDKLKAPVGAAGSLLKSIKAILKRKDENEAEDENVYTYKPSYAMEQKQVNFPAAYSQIAEESTYGNTVFLQGEKKDMVPKLISGDEQKYSKFELLIFPFIIGKLKEAVDGIVDDVTVSRIHAKIDKKDGQYYLIDLNSTNGTYLNGEILAPNEKTKLQSGDQLQFGSVSYYFKLESANNSSH